ncbi:hypothetical protein D3C84_526860 [compost metagenome]
MGEQMDGTATEDKDFERAWRVAFQQRQRTGEQIANGLAQRRGQLNGGCKVDLLHTQGLSSADRNTQPFCLADSISMTATADRYLAPNRYGRAPSSNHARPDKFWWAVRGALREPGREHLRAADVAHPIGSVVRRP